METPAEPMNATEILSQEHRVILRVLSCLERIVDAGARSETLNGADATSAIEFFRTYADRYHHSKEEDCLFPKLIERGLPEGGPIEVMLHEHELGRACVKAMLEHLPQAAEGQAEALAAFVHQARNYIDLLRQHINKEDHVLYPMAGSFLRAEDKEDLAAQYERAHTSHPEGTAEEMLALAAELCDRYSVGEEPETGARAGGSGCCM